MRHAIVQWTKADGNLNYYLVVCTAQCPSHSHLNQLTVLNGHSANH